MTRKLLAIALAGALISASGSVAFASPYGDQQNWDWQQPDRQGMRATHALNMLEAQGYGAFSHFHKAGDDFTADVTKNGRTMRVLIDPGTNQIQPQGGTGGNRTL